MKITDDIYTEDFQMVVDNFLKRNRNVLDTLSKYQTSSSRLIRAVTKAATQCGCIKIEACHTSGEEGPSVGISGELCKNCLETIENEMGDTLFYLAAICNAMNISMFDTILKEKNQLNMLGNFGLK